MTQPAHPTVFDPAEFAVYDAARMGKATLFQSEDRTPSWIPQHRLQPDGRAGRTSRRRRRRRTCR